jgi:hypothetical protein
MYPAPWQPGGEAASGAPAAVGGGASGAGAGGGGGYVGVPLFTDGGAAAQGAWMAAGVGAAVGERYLSELNSGLQAYLQRGNLKYYFAVSNGYVLNKLRLVLLPVTQRGRWERRRVQRDGELYYEHPRDDVFAPDLYLPVMALVTHVLLVALAAGVAGEFRPEMLGMVASADLATVALEVLLLKAGLYVLGVDAVPVLDLLATVSYVFVGVSAARACGLLFGGLALGLALAACALMMALFFVRALQPSVRDLRLVNDAYALAAPDARVQYFLLAGALAQVAVAAGLALLL